MKKTILYFLLLVSIFSCNEKIEYQDLIGSWSLQLGGDYDENREYYVVSFLTKNKIEVFDRGRKETLNYDLVGNVLTINLQDGQKETIELIKLSGDSLIAKDSITFFNFDNSEFEKDSDYQVEEYDLMDVEKDDLLPLKDRMSISFHLYQSNNGQTMFRGLNKLVNIDSGFFDADFPLLVSSIYSFRNEFYYPFTIYVGDGISLRDLKKAYYELMMLDSRLAKEVNLVLKKEGIANYYSFKDETDIDWFDIHGKEGYYIQKVNSLSLRPPPPPLPPKGYISKKDYLKMNPEIININSNVDLQKIENLNPQRKYFILIDNELSFEDYIDLKKAIRYIKHSKGIEIRTEIN